MVCHTKDDIIQIALLSLITYLRRAGTCNGKHEHLRRRISYTDNEQIHRQTILSLGSSSESTLDARLGRGGCTLMMRPCIGNRGNINMKNSVLVIVSVLCGTPYLLVWVCVVYIRMSSVF